MRKNDKPPAPTITPRLLTRGQAAAYCGLSMRGFARWRKDGKVPEPLPGTNKWDIRRLDDAIDALGRLGDVLASKKPEPAPEAEAPTSLAAWRNRKNV